MKFVSVKEIGRILSHSNRILQYLIIKLCISAAIRIVNVGFADGNLLEFPFPLGLHVQCGDLGNFSCSIVFIQPHDWL